MVAKNTIQEIYDIGKVVRYHRKEAGLSRIALAEISGVGKTSIYDIENGKTSVKMKTLLRILKVLNISLELSSPIMPNYKDSGNEKG